MNSTVESVDVRDTLQVREQMKLSVRTESSHKILSSNKDHSHVLAFDRTSAANAPGIGGVSSGQARRLSSRAWGVASLINIFDRLGLGFKLSSGADRSLAHLNW